MALRTAGQPSRAAEVLADALAIRGRELPGDHSWIAFTAAQLAWARFELQRYGDALAANERAIAILEKQQLPRHTLLASQLGLQGRILSAQDNLPGAAREFERGIGVLQKDAPPDTRLMAQFYWLLGGVRARLSSGDAPADAYIRALDLDRQTPSLCDIQRSEAELAIATRERAAGEPRQAVERLQRALSLHRKAQPGNPRLEASICAEIAQAYHELREYPDAEAMYLRTIGILKANGAEETASFQSITEALGALYRAQGKFAEPEALLRPN
jgi:tetratricopeptide (TPR) repeat protein